MSAAGGEAWRPGAVDARADACQQAACQAAAAGRYAVRLWSNEQGAVLAAIADAHGAVPAWVTLGPGGGVEPHAVAVVVALPAWAAGGRTTHVGGRGYVQLVASVAPDSDGCPRLLDALARAATPLVAGLWRDADDAWRVSVPDPLDLPY